MAHFEIEQPEGIVSEFNQTAFNINCLDFYKTVYVASDQVGDYSHPDSDAVFHSSTPLCDRLISITPLTPQLKSIFDRIHTPLSLRRLLALGSNDVYFTDDV